MTPWQIKAPWSTRETRVIDFKKILEPFREKPNSSLGKLWNPDEFKKAQLDQVAQTVFWDCLATERFSDGNVASALLISVQMFFMPIVKVSTNASHYLNPPQPTLNHHQSRFFHRGTMGIKNLIAHIKSEHFCYLTLG